VMDNLFGDRRLGQFIVNYRLPRQALYMLFTSGLIVVRAEPEPWTHSIKYTAIWDRFDEVPPGSILPEYEILFHTDGMGNATRMEVMRRR
jgi:hypothetical protein